MRECAFMLALAYGLDLILGDPYYRFHPIRLIGLTIESLEQGLRRLKLSGLWGGALALVFTVFINGAIYLTIRWLLAFLHPLAAAAFDVYVVYSCLAIRDLLNHAKPVSLALRKNDLDEARTQVGKIVGRDVAALDAFGVARATIESLAENFVDAVFSPLFWFSLLGCVSAYLAFEPCQGAVAGMLLFKTVSSLDSMVGYRNERYLLFGRFSARADDLMNFIPARLSVAALAFASVLIGQETGKGIAVFFRDRLKHASPNSAHGESFMAGALGLKLGGPTVYPTHRVSKAWLGDGSENATPRQIDLCARLIAVASHLTCLAAFLLLYNCRP